MISDRFARVTNSSSSSTRKNLPFNVFSSELRRRVEGCIAWTWSHLEALVEQLYNQKLLFEMDQEASDQEAAKDQQYDIFERDLSSESDSLSQSASQSGERNHPLMESKPGTDDRRG